MLKQEVIQEIYELLKTRVKKVSISSKQSWYRNYSKDFGAFITKHPKIIVQVTCESDISETLLIASKYKVPVTVRGAGHSCNGQTLTEDILLVNYVTEPEDNIKLLGNGLVEVPTRVTWYNLLKFLNKQGLNMPVVTDYLFTSVGGTLSVGGGYNNMSLHYGAQMDHVVKLKLILPNGDVVWCSPKENPDLFKFSLGGFSTLGVIETVIMQTCKYDKFTTYHTKCIEYNDEDELDDMFEQFFQLTNRENAPSWAHMGIGTYVPLFKSNNIFTRGITHLLNSFYYIYKKESNEVHSDRIWLYL